MLVAADLLNVSRPHLVKHVLTGSLQISFKDRELLLEPGDSLTFNPRELHTWRNPSETHEAVVLFAVAPTAF